MMMNNHHRINRIRINILDEMRKLRKKIYTMRVMQRHDLLQKRLEKCNLILFGNIQPYNHE